MPNETCPSIARVANAYGLDADKLCEVIARLSLDRKLGGIYHVEHPAGLDPYVDDISPMDMPLILAEFGIKSYSHTVRQDATAEQMRTLLNRVLADIGTKPYRFMSRVEAALTNDSQVVQAWEVNPE